MSLTSPTTDSVRSAKTQPLRLFTSLLDKLIDKLICTARMQSISVTDAAATLAE